MKNFSCDLSASLIIFIHSRFTGSNHSRKKLSIMFMKMACQMSFHNTWRYKRKCTLRRFLKKVFRLIPNTWSYCITPRINQIQLSVSLVGCFACSLFCSELFSLLHILSFALRFESSVREQLSFWQYSNSSNTKTLWAFYIQMSNWARMQKGQSHGVI